MNDDNSIQGKPANKSSRRKYILAAGISLLLIITSLLFIWLTQGKPKPDPASEAIIRQFAAKRLYIETEIEKDPNELSDEDFAKINMLDFPVLDICDIILLEKFVNLKELQLNSVIYPYEAIPTWMKILSDFGVLNLKDRFLIDLSPISNLKHLKTLVVSDSQFNNIKPISSLVNLQMLVLNGNRITNLDPIKELTNLQFLNLSDVKVSDLGSLKGLVNLETLIIEELPISDIEPIKNLPNLHNLWIYNCNITNEQVEDLQKTLPNLKINR